MRLATAAALLFSCVLAGAGSGQMRTSPTSAGSASPWNVLAYGGKGVMEGAPICHPLAFFSKSPLPLDLDADFYGVSEADLITRAQIVFLGAIESHRIYEVKLTVARKKGLLGPPEPDAPPTMKVLLAERGREEFCDIYQNQYAYDPTQETDEAAILDLGGKPILKTFETDRHTWFLEYWAIESNQPLRLKIEDVYKAVDSISPPGAIPFRGPLN